MNAPLIRRPAPAPHSAPKVQVGGSVPSTILAELDANGAVRTVSMDELLKGKKAVLLGVPGAFTPVCTYSHLPDFIAGADELRAHGYEALICVVASDPFATAEWARQIDPDGKFRYLSDGNLDFSRAAGLVSHEEEMFLGERCRRYVMTLDDGVVVRLRLEPRTMHLTCTRAADVLDFD